MNVSGAVTSPPSSVELSASENTSSDDVSESANCDSETQKTIAVGAGLGAGLGTLLIIAWSALFVVSRRSERFKKKLSKHRCLPKLGSIVLSSTPCQHGLNRDWLTPIAPLIGGRRNKWEWDPKRQLELMVAEGRHLRGEVAEGKEMLRRWIRTVGGDEQFI